MRKKAGVILGACLVIGITLLKLQTGSFLWNFISGLWG